MIRGSGGGSSIASVDMNALIVRANRMANEARTGPSLLDLSPCYFVLLHFSLSYFDNYR